MSSINLTNALSWLNYQLEPNDQYRTTVNTDHTYTSGVVYQADQLGGTRSTAPWVSLDTTVLIASGSVGGVSNPSSYFVATFIRSDTDYYQGGSSVASDGTWSVVLPEDGVVELAKLMDGDTPIAWSYGAQPGYQVIDDYEVKIYSRTDIDYLQDTVPLWDNGSYSASKVTAPGTLIARLIRKDSQRVINSSEYATISGFPGLPRSFHVPEGDPDFGYESGGEHGYRIDWRSWTYDAALAAIAFTATGTPSKAAQVLQQLMDLQDADVTDSYGNSIPHDGALAFSYDVYLHQLFHRYVRTGALAWVGMACNYYESKTGLTTFRPMALKLAEYIETQMDFAYGGSARGGWGRYDADYGFHEEAIQWHSTEHNVDSYFFFRDLGILTEDDRWTQNAKHIKEALLKYHWNSTEHRFNQGIDDPAYAADVGTWGGLFLEAIGEWTKAKQSLAYVENHFLVTGETVTLSNNPEAYNETYTLSTPISGIKPYAHNPSNPEGDYSDAPSLVWSEGTYGLILLRQRLELANSYDSSMLTLQTADPMGGMLYGTKGSASLPYEFHIWPSLAGTGWGIIVNADPNALFSRDPMPVTRVKHKNAWIQVATEDLPLKLKHKGVWLEYKNDGPDAMKVLTFDQEWLVIARRSP